MSIVPLVLLGTFLTFAALAQESQNPPEPAPTEAADQDTNPIRPVFWSLRQEYYNFPGDFWGLVTIVRKDVAILEKRGIGSERGVILRIDAPVVQAVGGSGSEVGLGDFYGQALVVPYLSRKFAIATGAGITFPTATDSKLGAGKWQLSPALIPVWFFVPKGLFLLRFQDRFSFAGSESRQDVHLFQAQPAFLWRLNRRLWTVADTEATVNWENGNAWSFKSGLQMGWMFNRRFGLALKPEVNWGGNQQGDWALKVLMIWVRLN